MKKKSTGQPVKNKKQYLEKENNIIEGALKVFGEKGYEETTISAISKAAKISDATIYEYFSSKEDVLFSIAKRYTQREYDRIMQIVPYVHGAREKIRLAIQTYLEFYENNRLYTSVALLTLKGNRNFLKSEAYQVIRKSAQPIVDVYKQGIQEGVFRDDLDPYLVRNMILGFIEHLTTQWLLLGRPEKISECRDNVFDMVMCAIEKKKDTRALKLNIFLDGLGIHTDKAEAAINPE